MEEEAWSRTDRNYWKVRALYELPRASGSCRGSPVLRLRWFKDTCYGGVLRTREEVMNHRVVPGQRLLWEVGRMYLLGSRYPRNQITGEGVPRGSGTQRAWGAGHRQLGRRSQELTNGWRGGVRNWPMAWGEEPEADQWMGRRNPSCVGTSG